MDNLNFQDEKSRVVKKKEMPTKKKSEKQIAFKTPEKRAEIKEHIT
jgi:hypothetical protein